VRHIPLSTLAALALFAAAPSPALGAADPTVKCGVKRLNAMGKLAGKSFGCEAKGAGKGLATDPACLSKARLKFEAAVPAADTGLGCVAELDAPLAVLSGVAQGIPEDGLPLLRLGPERSRCDKVRMKAVGVAAAAALKGRAKHLKTGDQGRLDASLAKAQAKIAKAFAKGEQKGDCTTEVTPERVWRIVQSALCSISGLGTEGTQLTLTSPSSGLLTQEPQIDFIGTVASAPACAVVDVWGFTGPIDPSGGYTVPLVPLPEGTIDLPVRVMAGRVALTEVTTAITYERAAEAAADIDPTIGGTTTVLSGPLAGASMFIPAGAAPRALRAAIVNDPEHVPTLPFGEVAVGPGVLFAPEAELFNAPIELTLPVDPALLPPGSSITDVQVRGVGDDGWGLLPVLRTVGSTVVVSLQDLVYGPFVPIVPQPLQSGELLVSSAPARATIYVDGGDTGLLTPAVVPGVTLGDREVKLYVPGFNEGFAVVNVGATGGRLHQDLARPGDTAPSVVISSPNDGARVDVSFVDLSATATQGGAPLGGGLAVVSVNGEDFLASVQPGGAIAAAVALSPGENVIEVRVNGPTGETGVSDPITVERRQMLSRGGPAEEINRDLNIRLSWGTEGTDIDLHVFQDGNHAYYSNLTGIPGGTIDRDDTDGRGPEIFTLPQAPPGSYRIAVDSFRIADMPTTASLTVTLGTRTEFTDTYTFTSDDGNATNGSPTGANPAAFWDALEFEITELRIDEVQTTPASQLNAAIFTTNAGENEIRLLADAPAPIPDEDVNWLIQEVNEAFDLEPTPLEGRSVSFFAAHRPLQGLIMPRDSKPLVYEIIAHLSDLKTFSRPVILTQEVRSQIRQEYVDKRSFDSTFVRETPDRATILDASQFVMRSGEVWDFAAFAISSDFAGLAVIDDSRNIANSVSRAWQAEADKFNPIPAPVDARLRMTSGWRNPRRNDVQSTSNVNSFHQTGDAVDMNPAWNPPWPLVVTGCLDGNLIDTYEKARLALTCLARRTLGDATYDVILHAPGPHVHMELDP
jgi:uncharacterized protein YfaP (DUF2135 family)